MPDDSTVINELYELIIQSQHFQSHCTDLIFTNLYHKTANLRSHKLVRVENKYVAQRKQKSNQKLSILS